MKEAAVVARTKAFREFMWDSHINMTVFAGLIGVDSSTVSRLMKGKDRVGSTLIAGVLNVVDGEFRDFYEIRLREAGGGSR